MIIFRQWGCVFSYPWLLSCRLVSLLSLSIGMCQTYLCQRLASAANWAKLDLNKNVIRISLLCIDTFLCYNFNFLIS